MINLYQILDSLMMWLLSCKMWNLFPLLKLKSDDLYPSSNQVSVTGGKMVDPISLIYQETDRLTDWIMRCDAQRSPTQCDNSMNELGIRGFLYCFSSMNQCPATCRSWKRTAPPTAEVSTKRWCVGMNGHKRLCCRHFKSPATTGDDDAVTSVGRSEQLSFWR